MTAAWQYYPVPFKFMLSDKTLFAPTLWLQVREMGLSEEARPAAAPMPPDDPLRPGSEGFLVRSLRIAAAQPSVRQVDNFICYAPAQYRRYYVSLDQSFDEYKAKFSSKTRSTINR
jgi:hypothetical protein